MTWRRLLVGAIRFALLALPIWAVFETSIDDVHTFTLLCILSFLLLRAFGYDILEYAYSTEIAIWVQLFIATRVIESVEHTTESMIIWGFVILGCIAFTVAKSNKLTKFYLDEFSSNDKIPPMSSTFSVKSFESIQRDQIGKISFVNLVLLCSLFFGFTVLRMSLVYSEEFTGDVFDDLNLYAQVIGAILLVILTIRSTSLTIAKSATTEYTSLFLLILLIEGTRIWLDDLFLSQVITGGEMVVGLIILTLIFRQMTRIPGPITNAMVVGLKELFVLLWTIIKSQPISLVLYVVISCALASLLDNVQWESRTVPPGFVTGLVCPIQKFFDETVSKLFVLTNTSDAFKIFVMIVDQLKAIRYQLRYLLIRFYPWIDMGCHGPFAHVKGTQDPVTFLFMALPLAPSVLICTSFFIEVQRMLRSTNFWLVLGTLSFGFMMITQITADVTVSMVTILKGSVYTRTYTSAGICVVLCQLGLVLICVWQFMDRYGIDNKRTSKIKQVIDKGDKVLNMATSAGFVIAVASFFTLMVMLAREGPISNVYIDLTMDETLPDYVRKAPMDDIGINFPSLLPFLASLMSFFIKMLNPFDALANAIKGIDLCIVDICLIDNIIDGFGSLANFLLETVAWAGKFAIQKFIDGLAKIPGSPIKVLDSLIAGLPDIGPLMDLALSFDISFDFLDGLFGVPVEIPSNIQYGFIALVVIMMIIGALLLVYSPGSFVTVFTNMIMLIFSVIFTTFGVYILKGYVLFKALGLAFFIVWTPSAIPEALASCGVAVGWLIFKYTGDEDMNELDEEKKVARYTKL